jgi:hypothetical protein
MLHALSYFPVSTPQGPRRETDYPIRDCIQQTAQPNGAPINQTACTTELCSQSYFDQFSECLNCIVSNGNNRAPGYHTNTSITDYPPQTTTTTVAGGYKELKFPLVDMELANQMFANLTARCQSASSTVTGPTTVTATPTTTYVTHWHETIPLTLTLVDHTIRAGPLVRY